MSSWGEKEKKLVTVQPSRTARKKLIFPDSCERLLQSLWNRSSGPSHAGPEICQWPRGYQQSQQKMASSLTGGRMMLGVARWNRSERGKQWCTEKPPYACFRGSRNLKTSWWSEGNCLKCKVNHKQNVCLQNKSLKPTKGTAFTLKINVLHLWFTCHLRSSFLYLNKGKMN